MSTRFRSSRCASVVRLLLATLVCAGILVVGSATPAAATTLPKTWLANQPGNGIAHGIGFADGTAWATNAGPAGHLILGPGEGGFSGRVRIEWVVQIDNIVGGWVGDNQSIGTALVRANGTTVVAQTELHRKIFRRNFVNETISLSFDARGADTYEWILAVNGSAYVKVSSMTLRNDPDAPAATWEAEGTSMYHVTGAASPGGWEATPGTHTYGFLTYGPYVNNLDGTYRAVFRMKTDKFNTNNAKLATIRVAEWTSVASHLLTERDVHRRDFLRDDAYQDFALDFVATPGRPIEFQVIWHANGYVKQDHVRVHRQSPWFPYETESNPAWRTTGIVSAEGVVGRQGIDPPGFIAYGPNDTVLYGEGIAVYTLLIENNIGVNDVAYLSVVNADTGGVLAVRAIKPSDFKVAGLYQDFRLRYAAPAGIHVGLYVNWLGNSTMKVNRTRVEDVVTYGTNLRFHQWWADQANNRLTGDPADHMPGRPVSEVISNGLSAGINATQLTLNLTDGSRFPDTTTNGPFYIIVYTTDPKVGEVLLVTSHTAASPNTMTVQARAGTTHWPAGSWVVQRSGRRQNMSISSVVSNGSLYYSYWEWVNHENQARGVSVSISSDGGKTWAPYKGGEPVITPGPNAFDAEYATVPHVVRTGDGFVMVYEAYSGSGPQSIGYAVSSDGLNWTKGAGPIVTPSSNPNDWDAGLSSPSVNYWSGTFYVWYSGASGTAPLIDYRGFSSGTNIAALAKHGPPVISPAAGHFDSGAIGKANVVYDGTAYFMAYEGGPNNQCEANNPRWGVGIARSTDLVNWVRSASNPIFLAPPPPDGCQMQAPNINVINGRQVVSVWDGNDSFNSLRSIW